MAKGMVEEAVQRIFKIIPETEEGEDRREEVLDKLEECVKLLPELNVAELLIDADSVNAREAIFGFMGWLTTRSNTLSVGIGRATNDEVARYIKAYCDTQGFAEVTGNFEKRLLAMKRDI